MDEEQFLRSISKAPDDHTTRLVYADWLEEQDDPRAEFVRLQVRLQELPDGDPDRPALRSREEALRADCPPYWLARLDPPVWCVVGNIVDHRPATARDPSRRGTRLFRPNAKIFLASRRHAYSLLASLLRRTQSIIVVGQHRKSRKWIGSWVDVALTTNWRVRLIHHPGAMVRLREAGWPGFVLPPAGFPCPADPKSPEAIEGLFNAINAVVRSPG